jgi:hypothetical protein
MMRGIQGLVARMTMIRMMAGSSMAVEGMRRTTKSRNWGSRRRPGCTPSRMVVRAGTTILRGVEVVETTHLVMRMLRLV